MGGFLFDKHEKRGILVIYQTSETNLTGGKPHGKGKPRNRKDDFGSEKENL